jgi:hypothetical protein
MEPLIILLGAHFIADMPLQSNWMAELKGKRLYILFAHAFIYSFVISLCLEYFGVYHLWKFGVLLGTHMCIDFWKTRFPKDDAHWCLIYIDQTAHMVINMALAYPMI